MLLKSVEMPAGTPTVQGYNFEGDLDLQKLLDSMLTSGFQATQLGRAVDEVNRMLRWRLSDEPVRADDSEEEKDPAYRENVRTKIFLGFTSNLISSGVREQLVFMMKHRMIDVLVTTAGGVEEDSHQVPGPDVPRRLEFARQGAAGAGLEPHRELAGAQR